MKTSNEYQQKGPQFNLTLLLANNKNADQPAHPCSLINAFVNPSLDSIIPKLATCKVLVLGCVLGQDTLILALDLFNTGRSVPT